jgi:hypothetical protein
MREFGTFRYQVNDPGCAVLPQQGDGGLTKLPFSWPSVDGDTPVFESPGAVIVVVGGNDVLDQRVGHGLICRRYLRVPVEHPVAGQDRPVGGCCPGRDVPAVGCRPMC